jgi:hypothetical protein
MYLITILLFFIISYSLSFIIDLFYKYKANIYEQLVIRLGFGILAYTVITIIMDFLFIPLNYLIILIISIIFPIIFLYKTIKAKKKNLMGNFKKLFILKTFKEKIYYSLVFLMFILTAFMYISGSFSYSYMENGDPWGYAAVSKQIAETQTIKTSYNYHHYSEPYTQGYQIVLATLHQSNDSIYWTIKFFHNFIISLSILFFFFFVKELFRKDKNSLDIAFYSTLILFSIPSWLSHFIFSLTYNMTLIPILFYFLLKIGENTKNKYIAGIAYGGIILNHFFTAFIITFMILIYYFLKLIHNKKFNIEILESFFNWNSD